MGAFVVLGLSHQYAAIALTLKGTYDCFLSIFL